MTPFRLGVIGLGEMGQAHCRAIAEVAEAQLVAVAEPDETRRALGKGFGATQLHADYRAMIAAGGIDGVVIATPDALHIEPCLAAAAAGLAVFVEKPIATTVADAERIIAACKASGSLLMVGHILRYFPEYAEARKMVAAGALGRVVSQFARRTNVITQQDRLQGRVGVLMFLGVHDFDVLRWVGGSEPKRIFCESATSAPGKYDIENETFTTISFQDGSIGCVHAGWYLPATHPAGFEFKLDVTGDKGIVNLDFTRHIMTRYTSAGNNHALFTPAAAEQMRGFVRAARDKTASPITGEDGLAALRMALAAGESLRSGVPVTL